MSTLRAARTAPVAEPPRPTSFLIHSDYCTIAVPPSAQTLAGFRALAVSDDFPERGRISFLDGEVFVDMSPEEIHAHGQVKLEITSAIFRLVKKLKAGQVFPDRTLLTNEAVGLSTEPDAAFATRKTLES